MFGRAVLGRWGQSPVPFLNEPLSPAAAIPGAAALTLTVNGSGFVSGSVVDWNGAPLATVYVNGSQLTATVPATDLAAPTSASVTVVNPTPSQGTSNPVLFVVTPATASLTTAETDLSPPGTPAAVIAADFNHDGVADLAVLLSAGTTLPNSVAIYLGNGDGTFGAPQTFAVGNDPVALCAADFNGDGTLDLAVVNDQDATVSILLGNGDGTFRRRPPRPLARIRARSCLETSIPMGTSISPSPTPPLRFRFCSGRAIIYRQAGLFRRQPSHRNCYRRFQWRWPSRSGGGRRGHQCRVHSISATIPALSRRAGNSPTGSLRIR